MNCYKYEALINTIGENRLKIGPGLTTKAYLAEMSHTNGSDDTGEQ